MENSENKDIKNNEINPVCGYSLKKNKLLRWIYRNKFTQPYVAKRLKMSVTKMKDKLHNRKPFSKRQIRSLVYLMGAKEAFKILYFPTLEERERVRRETFFTGWCDE